MAATYSSFMTTRFYSPVFNTALFDGPLRIYFSQSYESVALKIYHLLQSQYVETWDLLKKRSLESKQHVFLMIYPEVKDVQMVFDKKIANAQAQLWEEGIAIGFAQPQTEEDLKAQLDFICDTIRNWEVHDRKKELEF